MALGSVGADDGRPRRGVEVSTSSSKFRRSRAKGPEEDGRSLNRSSGFVEKKGEYLPCLHKSFLFKFSSIFVGSFGEIKEGLGCKLVSLGWRIGRMESEDRLIC